MFVDLEGGITKLTLVRNGLDCMGSGEEIASATEFDRQLQSACLSSDWKP